MKFSLKLVKLLLVALLTFLPLTQLSAENMESDNRLDSIVVTFDPPIINCINQSEELYQLVIETMKAPENGLLELITKSGAMWSASHSLCGVQFSLFHFDNPVMAAQICKSFLRKLRARIKTELKKSKTSNDFADYIHSLMLNEEMAVKSIRKPVSISCSEDMSNYVFELETEAAELFPVYQENICKTRNNKVLPGVSPTIYTVFRWSNINSRTFFTAKYLGEKFIKQAGLDQLIKYEIIYCESALNLVVYISGNEEQLAENIQKFRQIQKFELDSETPSDWEQFSNSLGEIMTDDFRDLAKKALFNGWAKHWQGSFDNLKISNPEFPELKYFGICMPTAHQHLLSFSSKSFPNYAAASRPDNDSTCDITLAIGGENKRVISEIYQDFSSNPSAIMPLNLTRDQNQLRIIFHCNSTEVSGYLARLRNKIYNNLVEKGLISDPIDTLKIGIAGVSSLPPFELRGLLQQGWTPIPSKNFLSDLPGTAHAAHLLNIGNASKETLKQRWQLCLASSRGRSELLASIAAAGYKIKDFNLPE